MGVVRWLRRGALPCLLLLLPVAGFPQFAETPLTSGTPRGFTVPIRATPVLLCCFRLEVPAGATQLEVRVGGLSPEVQFANVVRFGEQPIASPLTSDYPVVVGNNPLVITTTSTPPLRAGVYFIGTAVISSPTAQNATMTATVTADNPPRVAVSALNLSFTTEVGVNPPPQNLGIRNNGGGTLDFEVTSTAAWLSIAPNRGSSTGQPVATVVSVNVSGLGAGTHDAALRIVSAGIAGAGVIPVRLQLNPVVPPPPTARPLTSVSAASLRAPAAPDSIVSSFGQDLAAAVEVAASADLPESLGGITVAVTDSSGTERTCRIFFVAPGQVNFLLPGETALGTATVRIRRGGQVVAEGTLVVERVAPAVFTANSSGQGVAAAQVLRVKPDGTQTVTPIFTCAAAGNCTPVPIDLSGDDQVFLLVYGTGLRGRTGAAAVSATINGESVEASDAVAQGQYLGLDQVNLRLLSRLAARGVVNLILTIDGRAANTVTVHLAGAAPGPPPPPTNLQAVPSGKAYQPVAAGMEWGYRVTFPQTARVPHKPVVEQPEGLLCSNVFCGLQTWNAGQIEFRVIATEMVSDSGGVDLWNASVTDRGADFFFPTAGPIQLRRRLITEGSLRNVQLELVHTPGAGLRLVRPLSRPNQGSLISGITSGETITVPAGTFRNVVTAETVVTGDATSGFTGTYRTEIKLAPYVGIIRAIMRDPNGQVLFTQELTRFIEPSPLPLPRFRISNLQLGQPFFDSTFNSTQLPIEIDFEDPSGTATTGFLTIMSNLDGFAAGLGTLRAQGVTSGQTSGRMQITTGFPLIRLVSGRAYVFTFVLRNENGDESNALGGTFTPP